jgi:uncharacterized repeat protein (TIGR03847 family)
MARTIDLNPVSAITTDAVGQPGQRVFYLQARRGPTTITIETEKEQVRALALGIHQFLEELTQRFPERTDFEAVLQSDLNLAPPLEPEFKAGQMGLGYDSDQDLVVVVAQALQLEGEPEEDAVTARFWITRGQAKAMADHALNVVSQGRPMCALCGRPINPEGHFCPKRNGHTTDLIVQ